jgi:hypothetical protein
MKAFTAAAMVAAIYAAAAMQALAQGPAIIASFQPVQPASGCAFFQVSGGAAGDWYTMDANDLGFDTQFGTVMSAYFAGASVQFDTAGLACGFPKVAWLAVGTVN